MTKLREMSSGVVVIVPINSGSDGDPTVHPSYATHTPVDPPTLYLEKIGQLWMETRGQAQRGVTYRLDRLPHGYTLWERPRPGHPKHVDKWLFGGPRGKFDSPNRYYPHFLHLMETGGSNIGCPCTLCSGSKGVLGGAANRFGSSPSISTSASAAKPSMPMTRRPLEPTTSAYFKSVERPSKLPFGRTAQVDDEGTPDVYRNLIDDLQQRGSIDEDITETLSMDWRAERALTLEWLRTTNLRPPWMPRIGDVVLFLRNVTPGEEVQYDEERSVYRVYDTGTEKFIRPANWEAGVVSQSVHHDISIPIADLIHEPAEKQEWNVNYAGLRVEPLPELGSKDKTLSMQHKYVYLHQVRPFIFWREFLINVPEHEWHPTIHHAITLMSTFSLVEKFRFKGTWPSASVYCEGMYISSELILVGDTVRLLPENSGAEVTDVLKIRSIQLTFTGLDQASKDDYDDGRPYQSTVFIFGTGYTWRDERWILKHDLSRMLKVSFNRILGRHYENEAMNLWFPGGDRVLGKGRKGMESARKQARLNDSRIKDGKQWYWAESRNDALDLKMFNGQDVVNPERDPKEWRKLIKVMEGVAGERERMEVIQKAKAQRSLRNSIGMFTYDPRPESDTDGFESGPQSRKRTHSMVSRDEDLADGEQPELSIGAQSDVADEHDMELDRFVDDAMEELSS
ncbi:hypothetical protein EJ05DRAFT_510541 [Pseudovirgaria hyperparasitica]|uniref:Cryptic loci regulator 2 N-terminal domain-containing protein n=1 Tax=Pseudovirgaria hyperparasitica TaxID=470096 RepID=A0A6A6WC03_9PEZI|nr:uncharacterized protein EJ05DRAFT_510541 [Pseudovirgaria hyperparasitica]KAF2758641.1 hypothetical protein EJ05DRAFT_510541 [Pseudovirgaria hyperparasitica]